MNKMIELITFSNGISEYMYSEDIHEIYIYCNSYGLDRDDYNTFYEVKKLLGL